MAPKKIYMDYAASTPVDPAVFDAMRPYFSEKFGNPGSVHSFGQEAIVAVDIAREHIAKAIGADFRQVIFTSSATEANNLMLRGSSQKIIVSAIEHESVLETARNLGRTGTEVVYIPVGSDGIIDLEKLKNAIDERTTLVSVMYANNETGVVQPVQKIAEIVKDFKRAHAQKNAEPAYPLLHTDAAQAFQFLDCNGAALGVDAMTFSSHKIYGPKGAGALYIKNAKLLTPLITGGGQEFGVRSGTENVPAIAGFAKAVGLALEDQKSEAARIVGFRGRLWDGIKKIVPQAELNVNFMKNCLPNMLNIYFPGHEAQDILTKFDLKGLAASSGSACRSRALEASYALQAMGYSAERAKSSIRFSFGRPTTEQEVEEALAIISETFLRD